MVFMSSHMSKLLKLFSNLVPASCFIQSVVNNNMLHYMLQNVAKGVDIYDEMLHYPWLLHLTKCLPVS